jgi:adenylate cyclase
LRRALELIRLRAGRTWPLMFILSAIATGFSVLWWEYDVLEIHDDERGAYDDGLKAFTLPKRAAVQLLHDTTGIGKPKRSEDIVIVGLEDKTMTDINASQFYRQRYGANLPFDRVVWSDMIRYLSESGAKAIVFDMFMNEKSSDGTGDLALEEALKESKVPVFLGFTLAPTAPPLPKVEPTAKRPLGPVPKPKEKEVPEGEFPEDPTPEELQAMEAEAAANRLLWAAKAYSFPIETDGLDLPAVPGVQERDDQGRLTGKELPSYPMAAIPQVLGAMHGFGSVAMEEDEDGKLRKTQFAYTDGVLNYPTLPLVAAAALWKADKITLSPGKLQIGDEPFASTKTARRRFTTAARSTIAFAPFRWSTCSTGFTGATSAKKNRARCPRAPSSAPMASTAKTLKPRSSRTRSSSSRGSRSAPATSRRLRSSRPRPASSSRRRRSTTCSTTTS